MTKTCGNCNHSYMLIEGWGWCLYDLSISPGEEDKVNEDDNACEHWEEPFTEEVKI